MEEAVFRELSEKWRGHKTSERPIGEMNESEERARRGRERTRRRKKEGGRDRKKRKEEGESSSSVNTRVSGVDNKRTTCTEAS